MAHDTIEPMAQWKAEILKGLETMEIMLAFVTDDFHQRTWTDQEVGFALGRNIPVLSLKLQQSDPEGFIGDQQALRGSLNDPAASVPDIYELLAEKLGNKERLQSGLISAFVASPSFDETRRRFDRVDEVVNSLSDDEVASVTDGFAVNDQLYRSIYLTNRYQRLCRFLKHTTGKDYVIDRTTISPVEEAGEDKIPF